MTFVGNALFRLHVEIYQGWNNTYRVNHVVTIEKKMNKVEMLQFKFISFIQAMYKILF